MTRIEIENAAMYLEEAAWLLRSKDCDLRRVQELLASASAILDEELQPPCTCGRRQGTDASWSTSCQRHPHLGVGYVSTHRSVKRFFTTAAERTG
jgi:hypothetical protein